MRGAYFAPQTEVIKATVSEDSPCCVWCVCDVCVCVCGPYRRSTAGPPRSSSPDAPHAAARHNTKQTHKTQRTPVSHVAGGLNGNGALVLRCCCCCDAAVRGDQQSLTTQLTAGRLTATENMTRSGMPKTKVPSRRRDCHFTAPRSTFSRCFNSDEEGVSAK